MPTTVDLGVDLGTDDAVDASSVRPVAVEGVADAVQVRAGEGSTCALHMDGDISCWGTALDTPLARGTAAFKVPGISGAISIASRRGLMCAVVSGGGVSCWSPQEMAEPFDVPGLAGATEVAVGDFTVCGLVSDKEVACVGNAEYGALGNGTSDYDDSIDLFGAPVQVSGLSDVVQLGGGDGFFCALQSGGSVSCWGKNGHGQLGTTTVPTSADVEDGDFSAVPVTVDGVSDAVSIGVGSAHACVVQSDGSPLCWGSSDWRQLGNPSIPSLDRDDDSVISFTATPSAVEGLTDVEAVVGGSDHSCSMSEDGGVKCWGNNWYGQLGHQGTPTGADDPPETTLSYEPVDVGL